jgi:hypothetical protein
MDFNSFSPTYTNFNQDEDIINLYNSYKPTVDKRHEIHNVDYEFYLNRTARIFDFIFINFYDLINEKSLIEIEKCIKLCKQRTKNNALIMGWYDINTSKSDKKKFEVLFSEV